MATNRHETIPISPNMGLTSSKVENKKRVIRDSTMTAMLRLLSLLSLLYTTIGIDFTSSGLSTMHRYAHEPTTERQAKGMDIDSQREKETNTPTCHSQESQESQESVNIIIAE
jgi:hypothetical protein